MRMFSMVLLALLVPGVCFAQESESDPSNLAEKRFDLVCYSGPREVLNLQNVRVGHDYGSAFSIVTEDEKIVVVSLPAACVLTER